MKIVSKNLVRKTVVFMLILTGKENIEFKIFIPENINIKLFKYYICRAGGELII